MAVTLLDLEIRTTEATAGYGTHLTIILTHRNDRCKSYSGPLYRIHLYGWYRHFSDRLDIDQISKLFLRSSIKQSNINVSFIAFFQFSDWNGRHRQEPSIQEIIRMNCKSLMKDPSIYF